MAKYRGSSKTYSVPNKPLSLFKITAGDGSGGGLEPPCPRNAAGQRVSEAGAGEGPLHGGPRDADGFLMKAFDDALKIVIYEDMTQGEREFAIAFMEQDTPAPPGTPNACLSKYERAIIATYNNITTAEMNGDTHINELLKREAGKPRPERVPENPLVLKGVGAGNSKAGSAPASSSAPKSEPEGFQGNTTIQRLAALEDGTVQNASADVGEEDAIKPIELISEGLNLFRHKKNSHFRDKVKVTISEGPPIKVDILIDCNIRKAVGIRLAVANAAVADIKKYWNTTVRDDIGTYRISLNLNAEFHLPLSEERDNTFTALKYGKSDIILRPYREEVAINENDPIATASDVYINLRDSAVPAGRVFVDEDIPGEDAKMLGVGLSNRPEVAAHEFGHVLGMMHNLTDSETLMQTHYKRGGIVTARDARVLAALYYKEGTNL